MTADSVTNLKGLVTLVALDNIAQIELELRKDSRLLEKQPTLITHARTAAMAETLLQLDKLSPSSGNFDSSMTSDLQRDLKSTMQAVFPTVLHRWPKVALRILNDQIQFNGECIVTTVSLLSGITERN